MPSPSPLSRVMLGASLTIAVAAIIVVASSRPSISKQDTQLLLQTQAGDAGPPTASAESPQVSESGVLSHDDADSPDSPDGAAALPAGPGLAVPEDSAADNARLPGNAGENSTGPEQAEMPREAGSAVEQNAAEANPRERDAAEPQSSRKQPPKKTKKPAATPAEESKADSRIDPLKRLSLEFARRAAARGEMQVKATPVAPPANEIFPPKVFMSQEHRKSCVVFVGDAMPDAQLKDIAGVEHSIRQSLGKNLTAIVFWTSSNPYALDQFEELQSDLVPFTPLGVQTIAVHVGPEPANYAELCQKYGQHVLCLSDRDESYFKKVSLGSVPRSFLLDGSGTIIWLDIEYSRTTRYELRNALHFSLRDE